jgi:hypothetical protein
VILRSPFLLIATALTTLAVPASAQFGITVQQNGQAFSVASGGTITLNAPAAGQTASATVTLTYLGANRAQFPSAATILGPTSFSTTAGGGSTLSPQQSATFDLHYTPSDTAQAIGQFSWVFNEISSTGTTLGTGAIAFNLVGEAPNIVVGELNTNNSFQAVADGGTFQFPDTAVNSASTLSLSINNAGSGPATINSITSTGSAYQLRGVPLLPLTLNPGSQLQFTAQFLPVSAGASGGSLQIALASGSYTASLAGTGVSSFLAYQITQDNRTSAITPGQTITLDDTQVGSKSSVVLQLQYVGTVAAVLSNIAISGTGFSITDGPFLPVTLQPQQTNSITITYAPAQPGPSTGRLIIGNDNFPLSAKGLGPLLQFSYQAGSSTISVNNGDAVSFPPLAVGQNETIQFTMTNNGTSAASIISIGVQDTKGIFQLGNLPALPLQLAPNATAGFSITFSPQSAGQSTTALLINNQGFILSGFSSPPPPLPGYHFTGASGTQQPFQQPAIGLSLDSPYAIGLSGVLTLTIASNSFASDPAVQFSSGGRQVAFTIPANTLDAVFPNGSTQIRLQTGTVAGTIQISPGFAAGGATGPDVTPANPASLALPVPSLAPTLLSARLGTLSTTGFSVVVTGYSTTRFLDHMTFQFTPASGFSLSATSVTVDLSAAARLWFLSAASQNLGGQFNIQIPFSLGTASSSTTDLSRSLSRISVVGANDVGSSNAAQIAVP